MLMELFCMKKINRQIIQILLVIIHRHGIKQILLHLKICHIIHHMTLIMEI